MGAKIFLAGSKAARLFTAILFTASCNLHAVEPAATEDSTNAAAGVIENSVVKIFSSVRYPDPYKPWAKQAPEDYTGSGVVIEGKRILTNAHVVDYASQVQIQAWFAWICTWLA